MPKITKQILDEKGQAVDKAAQELRQVAEALASCGRDLDKDIRPFKAGDAFDFPGGGDDQKITDRLNAMVTQYGAITGQAQRLNTAVNDLFVTLGQASPVAAADLTQAAVAAATETAILATRAEEKPAGVNFAEFLSNLGEAMVETQRKLDQQSIAYLAETANSVFSVPTAFRLPKLSGRMQFELQYDRNQGVNLIFHSRGEKEIQRNQQSIEFDIVSVPAPPDATSAIRDRVSLDLVFDARTRQAILNFQPREAKDALPQEALDHANNVLILRTQTQGEAKHLLIYGGGEKDSNVGMWIAAGNRLEVVYRFQKQNGEFEGRLRDFAVALAGEQQKFLQPPAA